MQDRSVRDVLLSAQTVKIAGEACVLIGIRDISKVKEAEKALIEIDTMRKEFISTAAHELRTPLSVLIGYSEILTDPEMSGKFSSQRRQEALEMIKEKGLVLNQIVDDLLDINRIEAGLKFGLKVETLNPNLLVKKAFEEIKIKAPKREIVCQLSEGEEPQLVCDGQRLMQVMENLLSNALKYTREGGAITLAGADHARAVRADQTNTEFITLHFRFEHVERRDAFGNADYKRDFGMNCFKYGIGSKGRGYENYRSIGAVFFDSLGYGIANWYFVFPHLTALSGSYAGNNVGAVLNTLLCVESAGLASDALNDQTCVFIYENAHMCRFVIKNGNIIILSGWSQGCVRKNF